MIQGQVVMVNSITIRALTIPGTYRVMMYYFFIREPRWLERHKVKCSSIVPSSLSGVRAAAAIHDTPFVFLPVVNIKHRAHIPRAEHACPARLGASLAKITLLRIKNNGEMTNALKCPSVFHYIEKLKQCS